LRLSREDLSKIRIGPCGISLPVLPALASGFDRES
jgi:hypothetical protein